MRGPRRRLRSALLSMSLWISRGRLPAAGLAMAACVAAPMVLVTTPAEAQEGAADQAATPTPGEPSATQFSAASNEEMKYRHLWIAYAVIQVLIFGFIWRTWSRQEMTRKELDDVRRRLAEVEAENG